MALAGMPHRGWNLENLIMMGFLSAITATLALAGGAGPVEDGVTAEQFLRLVKAQQASIRDVAFAFEGEHVPVGPHKDAHIPTIQYQGRYAWRSDGATYLEHYSSYDDERRDQHVIQAMLGGHGESAQIWAGYFNNPNPPVLKQGAGPGSFFSFDSPETFLFLWRLRRLEGPSDFGYKFLGWEEIDGHRCAHIEFGANPGSVGRLLQELWVDLERGAHPLQIRNSIDGQTIYLIDQIRLREYTLPSEETVWFPVGGRFSMYHREGNYTREPAGRATTYVLNGTLVFNQGLGDGVFRVKADRFRPTFTPPVAEAAKPSGTGSVADLEAIEKKLDEALADPSRQGLARDAALTTRSESSRWSNIGWGLGLTGFVSIVIAGFIAWRRAV